MWATQVSVIKLIGDRLGPVAITFLPMMLSTLIFLPALWYEARKRGAAFHWRWADARHFLIAGIFGTFLIQFTYAGCVASTTSETQVSSYVFSEVLY